MLNTKGVIKLCVIMMINLARNTKNVVNVTATRRKSIIMIGIEKMTAMVTDFMINVEKITIIVNVVRRNSVIAVTDITKKSPPSGGFTY